MPSSFGALLATVALAGMSAAALPRRGDEANSITVELCGGHGNVTIPLGDRGPQPGRDCPGACHAALCGRKGQGE